jgi:competence protein ComEC
MRLSTVFLLSLTLTAAFSVPQTPKTLEIYVVDVEGGKSTLVVSPVGESVLIDTGNIGEGAQRDADRIMAAVKDAI